jgi:hypothetical protein
MKLDLLICLALVGCNTALSEPAQPSGGSSGSPAPGAVPDGGAASADGGADGALGGEFPLAAANLSYVGHYDVPTATPELAAAATFAVDSLHWSVDASGAVHLDYDLPAGLVGTPIHVEFNGVLTPGSRQVNLVGPPGTAQCTVAGTQLSCFERMEGLKPLTIDMGLVAAAALDYPGPSQHRIDVAGIFQAEPIGVVRFDLATGAVDDKGKNKSK